MVFMYSKYDIWQNLILRGAFRRTLLRFASGRFSLSYAHVIRLETEYKWGDV